jgi:hypothetical protein
MPEMSRDCGVVEADVECTMFSLMTPILQWGGDERDRVYSGEGMALGLDSSLKGTVAGLD